MAPQVLEGRYDYRCDAWSLGVILYILLCGFPPFYGDTDAEVLAQVKAGAYSFAGPEWRRVSDEGKDLIRKLLKINPDVSAVLYFASDSVSVQYEHLPNVRGRPWSWVHVIC